MAKKSQKSKRRCDELPILHPDAAGIDVGASELFVAVSADRDPKPVRSFPTFTRDLNALADWLQRCGIRSVAMESTSVYWIFGVDLTNVPGFSAITARTILCEIGTDVSRFRNASAFASWLGLCPENKISGGKVLYTKSPRVRSRVATALRMGAHTPRSFRWHCHRRCRRSGRPGVKLPAKRKGWNQHPSPLWRLKLAHQIWRKLFRIMVSALGLEPRTHALKGRCSTN